MNVDTAIAFQSRTTSARAAIGLHTNRATRLTEVHTRVIVLLPSVVMGAWSSRAWRRPRNTLILRIAPTAIAVRPVVRFDISPLAPRGGKGQPKRTRRGTRLECSCFEPDSRGDGALQSLARGRRDG